MQTITDIKALYLKVLIKVYDQNESEAIFWIVAESILKENRMVLLSELHKAISDDEANQFNNYLKRLEKAEPVQHILGKACFFDLEFEVNSEVLIPRQETELLIDTLLKHKFLSGKKKLLDIGTGSGCIAVSLKHNLPYLEVSALDISRNALEVAKRNALKHNTEIHFINDDILCPAKRYSGTWDIIVSNPPYVRELEKTIMHSNVVNYEPSTALYVNDEDPLLFYRAICRLCAKFLILGGMLVFEINEAFGAEVQQLAFETGFNKVEIIRDLNNKDRFILAENYAKRNEL
ncbi:MAG: peptide chain release factor N(5)-glutamine methyltransferase [Bacteroidales bacterium]|nr:peptide chain release factor N(5)-glutamine methyltransferase [Bacteroidales bacterium]MBN2821270.1 peptide chain release factor N(5)-glutamine methyltransferase [Bacteroidales bacterium]